MRRILPLLLAATALVFALGCAPEKSAPLRIGLNVWPVNEYLYLAQEKGFYADEGVEVHLVELTSLADSRRAYERGQLDIFGASVVEVLQVREQSLRSPRIIQVLDSSNGTDVILAQPGYSSIASLKGARIGVELASLGVYVLARALEKNGLTLSDVRIVSSEQASMEEAFRRGELEAVVTYSPISTKLLRVAQPNLVFSTRDIPGEVVGVIAVEADVATSRPEEVVAVLRAFHRAMAYARQHPDAYRIMAAREQLSVEEFRATLHNGDIHLVSTDEQADYFRPGGRLDTVVEYTDRILRASGQISGPDRRADILDRRIAVAEASP
jgi:NitT/TauT family transport system substrate-binding protein